MCSIDNLHGMSHCSLNGIILDSVWNGQWPIFTSIFCIMIIYQWANSVFCLTSMVHIQIFVSIDWAYIQPVLLLSSFFCSLHVWALHFYTNNNVLKWAWIMQLVKGKYFPSVLLCCIYFVWPIVCWSHLISDWKFLMATNTYICFMHVCV